MRKRYCSFPKLYIVFYETPPKNDRLTTNQPISKVRGVAGFLTPPTEMNDKEQAGGGEAVHRGTCWKSNRWNVK